MAWAPTGSKKKRRFFTAAAPNFQDFNGPPDGDYARYVEDLMDWAAQEQERLRLKALGAKSQSRAVPDAQWGREGSAASRQAQRPSALAPSSDARNGPVTSQALSHVLNMRSVGGWTLVVVIGLVLVAFSVLPWLPLLSLLLIGWAVFQVIRSVRAASSPARP